MLTRYAPFAEFEQLQRELSGLLNEFGPARTQTGRPLLNVHDAGDHFVATAELPGVRSEDVEVLVQGTELTIKAKRSVEAPQDGQFVRRERRSGSFARVLDLPVAIEASGVAARLTDGVLTVTLPKAPESQPRKIEINVG